MRIREVRFHLDWVRLVFCLSISSVPYAATLSTSVTCGVPGDVQTDATSCDFVDSNGSIAKATALFGSNSFYSVEAHTNVTGPLTFPGPSSSASVIYDADLTYTIVGYTGTGFIEPTFFGNAIADPEASSDAFAQLTFGSINDSANINGEFSSGERIPFVFGVPFTTHLHMEVTAAGEQLFAGCFCGGGNATIQFYPLDFNPIVFLADGQPAPGAFVFSTPEPSTLSDDCRRRGSIPTCETGVFLPHGRPRGAGWITDAVMSAESGRA